MLERYGEAHAFGAIMTNRDFAAEFDAIEENYQVRTKCDQFFVFQHRQLLPLAIEMNDLQVRVH